MSQQPPRKYFLPSSTKGFPGAEFSPGMGKKNRETIKMMQSRTFFKGSKEPATDKQRQSHALYNKNINQFRSSTTSPDGFKSNKPAPTTSPAMLTFNQPDTQSLMVTNGI